MRLDDDTVTYALSWAQEFAILAARDEQEDAATRRLELELEDRQAAYAPAPRDVGARLAELAAGPRPPAPAPPPSPAEAALELGVLFRLYDLERAPPVRGP